MRILLPLFFALVATPAVAADYEKNIRCFNSKCFYDDSVGQIVINQKELESIPVELSMADLQVGKCFFMQEGSQKNFLRLMKVLKDNYIFLSETPQMDFSYSKDMRFLSRYEHKASFLSSIKSISCAHTPTLGKEGYLAKCVDPGLAKSKYYCEKNDLY